jgi:hypothetical protein
VSVPGPSGQPGPVGPPVRTLYMLCKTSSSFCWYCCICRLWTV